MAVKYYVVDAFTDTAFKGNPAVVCWLEDIEKDDKWLQSVATEFNLPTTCYLTRIVDQDSENPRFKLRWFTTVSEVELCGHATLAAAHFLFRSGFVNSNAIEFSTLSGILIAKRIPDNMLGEEPNEAINDRFYIELDFPVVPISDYKEVEVSAISEILNGVSVVDVVKKDAFDDIIAVLPSEEKVAAFKPQFNKIKEAPGRAIIITAPASNGSGFDFCSRVFGPKIGVDEDPVTGSAHCALAVYWHEKLGKRDFVALQASRRNGVLHVHLDKENQRVLIRGKATTVMEGSLLV
ncbi:uncharacterized protein LOC143557850 [Bidens hawaiensis]|uniref:uncharacterized protein LOC143557850 n=1 Tax=Bidens hawaiensis TaxID=980011 RepID=UPI0040492153